MRTFPERLAALQPFWDSWYLDEFIGKGSFGEVYRIKKVDPFGDTYFAALKWLWIPQDADDAYKKKKQGYFESQIHQLYENDAHSIKKEIEVMKRLNGESHVVGCEDFEIKKRNGDFGWDILIRMELLTPLTDFFSSGMTVGDVVKLGVDICSALEILEREKIIHRDIKPDNIFVTRTGSYKLGDFGVAKQFSQTYATMSRQGTPLYMAPEVYRNEAKTDYSVDLYSLGLVMHELLNRQRMPLVAFTDSIPTNAERDAAFTSRISGTAIPAPIDGTLDLKKIVCKACAFKSNKRYHSAIEMKKDLLALKVTPEFEKPLTPNPIEGVGLNSGRTPPRRISQEELAETIPSNNSEERSDEEPHPQPAPKPKKWKLVLPLFCLVFIVVGIIGITQSPPPPLPPTLPPTSVTSTPSPTIPEVVDTSFAKIEENTTEKPSTMETTGLDNTPEPNDVVTDVLKDERATPVEMFEYSILANNKIRIDKYSATETTVEIPAEIDGRPVASIGNAAFRDCVHVVDVTIPYGVNSLGGYTVL